MAKCRVSLRSTRSTNYSTTLLVLTTYKPRGHDIENYGKLAASLYSSKLR